MKETEGGYVRVYELTRGKFTRSYVLIWQLWDINKSVMGMYQTCGENRGRGAPQTHDLIPITCSLKLRQGSVVDAF